MSPHIPVLLTPGAAEAIAVKIYRMVRISRCLPAEAVRDALTGYRSPIAADVLEFQIQLAIDEASDPDFIPVYFANRSAYYQDLVGSHAGLQALKAQGTGREGLAELGCLRRFRVEVKC